jgi:hypothetical protein
MNTTPPARSNTHTTISTAPISSSLSS